MSTVQSVERTIAILKILSKEPKGLGITEIHQKVELPKTTVHRILSTLQKYNLVIQDKETTRYKLGMYIVNLASSILENIDLRSIARPYLEQLRDETNEVIHLCIMENDEVVYIDKFEGNQRIRISSSIGFRAMMHCTGVGKVLLAGMDETKVKQILQRKGMPKFTKNTITDPDKLLTHLDSIRNYGCAIDEIEHEEGIRCMAAPVCDYQGEVIAAISISGVADKVTTERIEKELKAKILETSRSISNALGYNTNF
ncbi:IclR family transcriptional regulator [Peribacillus cavernae]|uniref:Glycerol operon regulatory protein n=1 Tax=Peribacillus cavernae TaxID=1674310 RepID=A0A3S0W5L7_9BACI|nr:IclR family transcriptional regulator [Peribacillus cavernae]MDQ0217757.1 DNA-binding IclR family transcriptional regulator [Peribacillus cavernae]RUQ28215.1 IclR family transcriptional regulator [Peribacillus cavernae]